MPNDVTYEDQTSAIGNGAMTANLTSSFDPLPGGAHGYFHDNTSDTMFESNDVVHEDQTSAIGNGVMTENLTTSSDLPPGGAYGYFHDNNSDTMIESNQVAHEDRTTSFAPSPNPMGAANYSVSGLSTNDHTNGCACIPCFVKSRRESSSIRYTCVVGCDYQCSIGDTREWQAHLKTHFKRDKKYLCTAPLCGKIFERWGELTRHYKTHCLRAEKYACDVFGCKYSGDNGFIRHDKLLSHKRNVHDGKAPPSQLMRRRRLQAKPPQA